MSRLTYSQGYAVNLKGMPTDVTCEEYCANIPLGNGCDGCLIDKAICKLAHYEDLEEQGRLIELPCKIGDKVWIIRNYRGVKHAQQGTVYEMYFTKEMKLMITVKYIGRGEYGKTIFATKEAAEAKLAEMEGAE